jgi:hypothetical protein
MAPPLQSIQPLTTLADFTHHFKTLAAPSTLFVAFLENNPGQDQ